MGYFMKKRVDKNVILHVGMGKTATTYLQKSVFPHIKDIYYTNRWKDDPIGDFARKIKIINPVLIDIEREKVVIHEFLSSLKSKTVLFSDEGLFGSAWENFNNNYYTTIFLKKVFPDAKVLMIIRKQTEWLESSYNYAVKLGYSVTADKYCNYKNGVFGDFRSLTGLVNVDIKQLNLYAFSNYYKKLFGKENVLILPYELFKINNNLFLDIIYKYFDIEPYYPKKIKRKNMAFSYWSINIAIFLNKFLVRSFNPIGFIKEKPFLKFFQKNAHKSIIYKILGAISIKLSLRSFLKYTVDKISSKKFKLLDENKSSIVMQYHKEFNEKLSDEIGIDLESYGYY